ncbi:MAG: MBL fold metallo-hydrolase [Bacteroidota bacterium]|nr:MBL fold metallo-hydrolase [Bacteroidota bacterium]
MEITFLGTGTSQGMPVIGCSCDVCTSVDSRDKRLRTSLMVKTGDIRLVIDSGPDFRYQMLRENVKSLDALLFTHEHRDHIAGLDDVRAFNWIQKKAMDLYAESRVLKEIREKFLYAFDNSYPGVPRLNLHAIEEAKFDINGLSILPIRLMHYKLPILGFRFGDISYITDASYISDEERKKLIGSRYLIVNALRREKHPTHFNLQEALQLIEEIKPEKAYLTHISHQMGLYSDILKDLPDSVIPAYDGLSFSV